MLMFRRPPVSSWKKFAFSRSSSDESSVYPSAASMLYDAQSMPVKSAFSPESATPPAALNSLVSHPVVSKCMAS